MTQNKIIISGGGYTGLLTALSLLNAGISCSIIEKQNLKNLTKDDGKSFAISNKTLNLFAELNLMEEISKYLLPIKACYCFEHNQSPIMTIESNKLLAGMMSAKILKDILINALSRFSNFELIDNYSWSDIKYNYLTQTSSIYSENSSIPDFQADLIISTEGKNSKMLEYFNIKQIHHDYKQKAIIFSITHEIPHLQRAIEKFFPEGAIAILPMQNIEDKNHSAIVWINKDHYNDYISNLNYNDFKNLFNKKIENILGEIEIVNFESKKQYPLTLSFLTKYHHNNIIFLGDINHSIHPIAGQGFNLTISDIKKITELLQKYSIKNDLNPITKEFIKKRLPSNLTMISFTHILVKMFENDNPVLKFIRNKSIRYIEKFGLCDKFF